MELSQQVNKNAIELAREVANAIREFTGSVQGRRFTVNDIAHVMGAKTDYVRMFLHKYAEEKTNPTFLARYLALNQLLPYYVADTTRRKIVYAYGIAPRQVDETFTRTPVKSVKPPVADTKIVMIEYPCKSVKTAREKTPEEYLAEITNEMRLQSAILRDICNIQRDTYNLFNELKDGKKK